MIAKAEWLTSTELFVYLHKWMHSKCNQGRTKNISGVFDTAQSLQISYLNLTQFNVK